MIRVSGLRQQVTGGVLEVPPDGMTPSEQLAAIHHPGRASGPAGGVLAAGLVAEVAAGWYPAPALPGFTAATTCLLTLVFRREVLPVLTPARL